jgi:SWI/SNF-related matrix-associated actin-dependent regulator of chromatin subfamily A member 5
MTDKESQIKPAKSAYVFFQQEQGSEIRKALKDGGGDADFAAMQRAISRQWKELDQSGKTKYLKLAATDRARFNSENEERDDEHLRQQEERRKKREEVPTEGHEQDDDQPRRTGRQAKSRLMSIGGVQVLKSNNYSLEGGEPTLCSLSHVESSSAAALSIVSSDNDAVKAGAALANKKRKQLQASKKQKPAAGEEARKAHNSSIEDCVRAAKHKRSQFINRHWELFRDFAGRAKPPPLVSGGGRKKSKKEKGPPALDTLEPSYLKPGTKLRAYQRAGVNWMLSTYHDGIGAILADEMGLGKTIQTITFLSHLKSIGVTGPHLIVCPLSVLSSWMTEFKKFNPNFRILKLHSSDALERERLKKEVMTKATTDEIDAVVTTYEMIKSPNIAPTLCSRLMWRYMVLDEGHIIKNEKSQIALAVRKVRCQGSLLLTGTPLQNNLHELWSILNFLFPDIFPDSAAFDDCFNLTTSTVNRGTLEKAHYLLRPFMLRRVKNEVEGKLSPKVETKIFCPLAPMQLFWYQRLLLKDSSVLDSAFAEGDEEEEDEDKPPEQQGEWRKLSSLLIQLRKCCNHPYLFPSAETVVATGGECGEDVVAASGKLQVLDRLLPKLQKNGHRVVLFSQVITQHPQPSHPAPTPTHSSSTHPLIQHPPDHSLSLAVHAHARHPRRLLRHARLPVLQARRRD